MTLDYVVLLITVLCLWMFPIPQKQHWGWLYPYVASVPLGLFSGNLGFLGMVSLGLFAGLCYYNFSEKATPWVSGICTVLVVIMSLLFMAHSIPGFKKLTIFSDYIISPDARPFSMQLCFDKTSIGIMILGFSPTLITKIQDWKELLRAIVIRAPAGTALLLGLSVLLGYVHVDPKIPRFYALWMVANLFFVCTAEEALFRGVVQKKISQLLKHLKYGEIIALSGASLLFGLVHYAGGVKYILLAFCAGMVYGYIYLKTQKVEGAIITHFLLNTTHFFFFTYPALSV